MANTYKNAAVVMTSTGATDLYTVPANMRGLVQSVNVANIDGSDRYVTVTWYDSSSAQSYTLLYNGLVPAGTSLNALDTPLVLEPGDIVRVQASAANTLHATASILQIDPTTQHTDESIVTRMIADGSITRPKMATDVSPDIICTSSTRPSSPIEGQTIYETDSNNSYFWNGSSWIAQNPHTYLTSAGTTQQDGAYANDFTYAYAEITITPGKWLVQAAASLLNLTTSDSATVSVWNQTLGSEVANSIGPPMTTMTTFGASPFSRITEISVASNTALRVRCRRNGASTIRAFSSSGGPAGVISAWRVAY